MKSILSFLFSILCFLSFSQWNAISSEKLPVDSWIQTHTCTYYELNFTELIDELKDAPLHQLGISNSSKTIIQIPLPNGEFHSFYVYESPIMEEELMNKFPDFKTFIVQNVKNPTLKGRIDYTHKGFHAMLFSTEGTIYIDPIAGDVNHIYQSYYKKDFITDKTQDCISHDEVLEDLSIENEHKQLKLDNGSQLRTYRIAVSATGEYTQFHGGTVADGLAAIVTSINRVNTVYERDFSIRLILIGNNDQVVHTNPNSDPFSNPSNASQNLTDNRNSLNSIIGESNYDIGHVVGREGSGLAGFRVVCSNSNFSHKANGTTGIGNPIGDPFDIDYLAHEIGHQFGGSHTFNGSSGSCATNISNQSAYEPGSGTTIMAYAGICPPQNTQNFSDDHFHIRSLVQVVDFIEGQGGFCAVATTNSNQIPSVSIVDPENLTIPISTPFELEALGSDNDGNFLTYCWEQYDRDQQGHPDNPVGNSPLFRSFSPTLSPIRVFPQLDDIVNNTQTLGEILPDYTRSMRFRVTVRDNATGSGAFVDETYDIDVNAIAGPFLVTNPNTNITWDAGSSYTVEWDVANTDAAPINCTTVDVFLSLDGGYSYPITLVTNVPNNGTTTVTAPNLTTTQARVKIKASNNVFFDISNQDFTINIDCNSVDPQITLDENIPNVTWCLNSNGQLYVSASSNIAITSYQWYKDGAIINGATDSVLTVPNVQLTDGGGYYCSISNGCTTINTNTATVFITSNAIVPVITQIGNELHSSLAVGNQWYLNGNLLPGETNSFITISSNGTYNVKSIAGDCSAFSEAYTVGLKDLQIVSAIYLFPNPGNGTVNVQIEEWNEDVELRVIDVLGKTIDQSITFKGQTIVNLNHLAKGVYYFHLTSGDYQATVKYLKK